MKDPGSNAGAACFTGPPIGGPGLVAGQLVTSQLIGQDGSPGEVFITRLAPARPDLRAPSIAPDAPAHLSTDPLAITLTTASSALPARREIRIRRALPSTTPCAAVGDAGSAYAVVAASDTYELTATSLSVKLEADQLLGDRAFGQLQVQLVDTAADSATDWVTLPGDFVRAAHSSGRMSSERGCAMRGLGDGSASAPRVMNPTDKSGGLSLKLGHKFRNYRPHDTRPWSFASRNCCPNEFGAL